MRYLLAVASLSSLFFSAIVMTSTVSAQDLGTVEIVVNGKQPGPPMWRVKNEDNTLYIFAWMSPIPKNIVWESQRVETVIAEAQEYITMPEADVSISPLVMFNPVNIFRGIRLGKRISRNPDNATLEEVLPPELYQRFSALKAKYFPRNQKFDSMRPLVAGGQMTSLIQDEANLVDASDVGKKIRRMVRRNRDIIETEIMHDMKLEGGYKVLSRRIENLMNSLSWELELSCFERQLTRLEEDIDEMQYRASTWAQGYIQEFKFIPLPGDVDDDCTNLIANSSEQDTFEDVSLILDNMWLDAAENALMNNDTTFAVLDFSQLLLEDGLVAQLAARGYEVIEP